MFALKLLVDYTSLINMTSVERLEHHNTPVHLSATVTYILETGEFRQEFKTVAQFGPQSRLVFSFLLTHPNIAVSLNEIAIAIAENPEIYAQHMYNDEKRIRASIKRIRTILKSVSEGLDERVETVKNWGYRWSDANAIKKSL